MNSFNNTFLIKKLAKLASLVELCYQCSVPLLRHSELHGNSALTQKGAQKGLRGKVKPVRIAQHGIATIVTQQ